MADTERSNTLGEHDICFTETSFTDKSLIVHCYKFTTTDITQIQMRVSEMSANVFLQYTGDQAGTLCFL